jgi:hypothetical protein
MSGKGEAEGEEEGSSNLLLAKGKMDSKPSILPYY